VKKRVLGRTGLEVSELGLGGLFASSHGFDFEKAKATICEAVELGINYIDTAPTYLNGETVLGTVLNRTLRSQGQGTIIQVCRGQP